eukprot:TRINITY_DN76107_c0_g1_i1.p1 TRINITY_DN76107_c0_g1~~TRINITY_DN76107_c0_g1_i1.p1  ORF type:complete len:704 (-),score=152.06 TRINITY_DN76107_c0_g1_i1:5-2116(-)
MDGPSPGVGEENTSALHEWRPRFASVSLQVRRLLGRGAFGEVHLAKVQQGADADDTQLPSSELEFVALKRAAVGQLSEVASAKAVEEAQLLLRLGEESDHILRCFDFRLLSGSSPTLELMLEYAPLGDLSGRIRHHRDWSKSSGGEDPNESEAGGLPEDEVICYGFDIASGLAHLHSLRPKVLHRDVKPANIVLFPGRSDSDEVRARLPRAKLADFGIAKILELETSVAGAATVIGTPHYFSPELCRGEQYDERADAWALGCVLYEMLCLHRPFHQAEGNLAVLAVRISEGKFDREALEKQAEHYNGRLILVLSGLLSPLEQRCRACDVLDSFRQLQARMGSPQRGRTTGPPASTAWWSQQLAEAAAEAAAQEDIEEQDGGARAHSKGWSDVDSWRGATVHQLEGLLSQLQFSTVRPDAEEATLAATARFGDDAEATLAATARFGDDAEAPATLLVDEPLAAGSGGGELGESATRMPDEGAWGTATLTGTPLTDPSLEAAVTKQQKEAPPRFTTASEPVTEYLGEGQNMAGWPPSGAVPSRLAWAGSAQFSEEQGLPTPPAGKADEPATFDATLPTSPPAPTPHGQQATSLGGTRLFLRPVRSETPGSAASQRPQTAMPSFDTSEEVIFCFAPTAEATPPASKAATAADWGSPTPSSPSMPPSPASIDLTGWQQVELPRSGIRPQDAEADRDEQGIFALTSLS